ncbi:hypothetical protein, partial [Segatella oulorum]|uniref:hypothetical protein n=1 Tax=Segatella oulorum TaxID=28136 RepID=UPI0028EA5EF7
AVAKILYFHHYNKFFFKKTCVQQVWNNHFSKKHAFSRCGTTIFLKNMCSADAEQPFSRKTCVQQVRNNHFRKKHAFSRCGTTVFEKNKRSKGLDDGLSQKRQLFGTEIGH